MFYQHVLTLNLSNIDVWSGPRVTINSILLAVFEWKYTITLFLFLYFFSSRVSTKLSYFGLDYCKIKVATLILVKGQLSFPIKAAECIKFSSQTGYIVTPCERLCHHSSDSYSTFEDISFIDCSSGFFVPLLPLFCAVSLAPALGRRRAHLFLHMV